MPQRLTLHDAENDRFFVGELTSDSRLFVIQSMHFGDDESAPSKPSPKAFTPSKPAPGLTGMDPPPERADQPKHPARRNKARRWLVEDDQQLQGFWRQKKYDVIDASFMMKRSCHALYTRASGMELGKHPITKRLSPTVFESTIDYNPLESRTEPFALPRKRD